VEVGAATVDHTALFVAAGTEDAVDPLAVAVAAREIPALWEEVFQTFASPRVAVQLVVPVVAVVSVDRWHAAWEVTHQDVAGIHLAAAAVALIALQEALVEQESLERRGNQQQAVEADTGSDLHSSLAPEGSVIREGFPDNVDLAAQDEVVASYEDLVAVVAENIYWVELAALESLVEPRALLDESILAPHYPLASPIQMDEQALLVAVVFPIQVELVAAAASHLADYYLLAAAAAANHLPAILPTNLH